MTARRLEELIDLGRKHNIDVEHITLKDFKKIMAILERRK